MQSGSCLCGATQFTAGGPLGAPSACHCSQCRKNSGHHWASTSTPLSGFRLTHSDSLGWYQDTPAARRGFCKTCGSFLFWQHLDEDEISISMSAFDTDTGLKLARHIFTADKGNYYDIADGLPQRPD